MARQAYVVPDKKFIFFWSPKCGNTSLAEWLVRSRVPKKNTKAAMALGGRGVFESSGSLVDFSLARHLVEAADFKSAILARHPYTRMASAFTNKFLYNGKKALSSGDKLERFAWDLLSTRRDWSLRGISFIEFCEFVLEEVASAERHGGEPVLDKHFNTQVPFAFADFQYDYVVKLEDVQTGLNLLPKGLGAADNFPVVRKGIQPSRFNESVNIDQMKSFEIVHRGIVPCSDSLLTNSAKELIYGAYGIDFQKLDYSVY